MMKEKSFTLIEVLVGTALVLIVFLGIFGAYLLGFKVIGLSERKITATQIAQGEIEKIRNLPYLEVGTIGAQPPYASGSLESLSSTTLNGTEYTIERKIKLISDSADGLEENCPVDYKKAEIKVSFSGKFAGEVVLTTDVIPKDKTEEAQICEENPIGILSVQVFNSIGEPVSSPTIEIFNPQTNELLYSATPFSGKEDIPLSQGTYKISVSKNNYSSERTYSIDEIAIPEKPNPFVLEGQITEISFLIDRVSSMLVKTLSTYGQGFFSDSFLDESKISQKENISISDGQATLSTTTTGYLISIEISPSNLTEWGEFSFADEEPEGTDLKYQLYYKPETEWILIPDSNLPGNSTGFDISPVDLSNLDISTYSSLKIKANFLTESPSLTPILYDWQISWKNSEPTPISNVSFDLRGEKLIGKDANENPVYKFSNTNQTNSQGEIQISNLEWDVYHFSNFQRESQLLDLINSDPSQPISLNPNTNPEVNLYLGSQNSLLITVQDSVSLEPIFSATIILSATGLEETQYTNPKGQTVFIPLEEKTYSLSVEAVGYSPISTTVSVSGKTTKLIKLEPTD